MGVQTGGGMGDGAEDLIGLDGSLHASRVGRLFGPIAAQEWGRENARECWYGKRHLQAK